MSFLVVKTLSQLSKNLKNYRVCNFVIKKSGEFEHVNLRASPREVPLGGGLEGSVTWRRGVCDKESTVVLALLWRKPCSAGFDESSGGGSGSDDCS